MAMRIEVANRFMGSTFRLIGSASCVTAGPGGPSDSEEGQRRKSGGACFRPSSHGIERGQCQQTGVVGRKRPWIEPSGGY